MKKRKLMVLLAVCSMSAMILGGCGQTTENTASNNESVSTESEMEIIADTDITMEENDSTSYQNTTVSGRVEKIEGNQITLQLMNDKGGQRPEEMLEGMEEGEIPPEMPEGMENEEVPTKEIGENPQVIPEGEVLDGKMPENMEEGQTPPERPEGMEDNTVVFTIEDESLISLDEISEGDFISITFDEDGNMTEISKMENPMTEEAPVEKREEKAEE